MATNLDRCVYLLSLLFISSLLGCAPKDNATSNSRTTDTQYIPPAGRDVNPGNSHAQGTSSEPTTPPANQHVPPAGNSAIEVTQDTPKSSSKTTDASANNLIDGKNLPDSKISVILADHAQIMSAIEKHKGKIVVLDVWSNSCIPCMREFPHLVEISNRWPELVRCVSLNVDYIGLKSKPPETYTPKVEAFVAKQKALFENFQSKESDESIFSKFKLDSIPGILVFDREGKLHAKFTDGNSGTDGLTYAGDVIPAIEKLLAAP